MRKTEVSIIIYLRFEKFFLLSEEGVDVILFKKNVKNIFKKIWKKKYLITDLKYLAVR